MVRTKLETLPVPRVVPDGVFDAFGWCQSDVLDWGRPAQAMDLTTPLNGKNPARMVFVFHEECTFLPRELARMHALGLGLEDEQALAPYAIDDATDELYERRIRPRDALWLAADNLNALVWGLHDWAHFHNHGPFEARAWTELQCDGAAIVWLWRNRDAIGLDEASFTCVRDEIEDASRARFEAEGLKYDPEPLASLTSHARQA